MKSIFLVGTAGSGKSSLCSVLHPWFEERNATVASVNLDPGVQELPYEPDIDIRDTLDISTVMKNYQLGPNGALIMAADLIATRMNDIQESLESINPDYAIFDTPGQVELFAYRSSGPYIVENLRSEGKTVLFMFDSTLVSTPSNFVSIALLAASIQLRLKVSQISVLSRKDLLGPNLNKVLSWSSNERKLEQALREESKFTYELDTLVLRDLSRAGIGYELYPVSATTHEGLIELSAIITRQMNQGEENEE
ncbi:MAG TPA: ATP/GTP-binding protein [Nitrososphaerales archaeon]|nr:ATP/GTP-binding protein [Nitrososphaerales archaeon]